MVEFLFKWAFFMDSRRTLRTNLHVDERGVSRVVLDLGVGNTYSSLISLWVIWGDVDLHIFYRNLHLFFAAD